MQPINRHDTQSLPQSLSLAWTEAVLPLQAGKPEFPLAA